MGGTGGLTSRRKRWTEQLATTLGAARNAPAPPPPRELGVLPVPEGRSGHPFAVVERPFGARLSGASARQTHLAGVDPLTGTGSVDVSSAHLLEVARLVERSPERAAALIGGGRAQAPRDALRLDPAQFGAISAALFRCGAQLEGRTGAHLTVEQGSPEAAALQVARWLIAQVPEPSRAALLTDLRASFLTLQRDLEGLETIRIR